MGTLGSQGFRGIRGLGKARDLTQSRIKRRLLLGLGLADADNSVAFLPFAALLEQLDTLETLEDVSLLDKTTGGAKTWVLAHDKRIKISFEAFGTSLNLRHEWVQAGTPAGSDPGSMPPMSSSCSESFRADSGTSSPSSFCSGVSLTIGDRISPCSKIS